MVIDGVEKFDTLTSVGWGSVRPMSSFCDALRWFCFGPRISARRYDPVWVQLWSSGPLLSIGVPRKPSPVTCQQRRKKVPVYDVDLVHLR